MEKIAGVDKWLVDELIARGIEGSMTQLSRPKLLITGGMVFVLLPVCVCGSQARGPLGGVCGNCAGAIPDGKESARLDEFEKAAFAKMRLAREA